MARGEKYSDEIKERARALLVFNNASVVAKELGLPYSTVKTWEKGFAKPAPTSEKDLEELRNEKKRAFVLHAWELIEKTETILARRIERATNSEAVLDEIVKEINADGELTPDKKKTIISKLSLVRLENVKELAVVLGTLYDKQALACKESTQIIGGDAPKFEDFV